jgi:hypothetical protein
MKKISILLLTLLVFVVFQKQSFAQATRTWVSGVGDDANPCSRTAPCKTFAGAISKTAAGGEIDILDSGGFGTVTITKAITIDGTGALGSILASSTNGIIVNAGVNDVVVIRNISINGAGTTLGLNGIRYLAGKRVIVENCDILNFSANSIDVALSAKGIITVKNTTISSSSSTAIGIDVNTSVDTATVVLDNVKIQGVSTAIYAENRANINVVNSMISNNARGIFAEFNTSAIRLSNTSILNNAVSIELGVEAIKPKVFSYGNNQIMPLPPVGILSTISSQ